MLVFLKKCEGAQDIPTPLYTTAGSAGMDLAAFVPDGGLDIFAGTWRLVACGFSMMLPEGFEAQIRPRSGLALNNGITVLNSPGTIDSDYRGQIKVILYNASDTVFRVTRGMRIAQMVIAPIVRVNVVEVDVMPTTIRGDNGFGSTGTK